MRWLDGIPDLMGMSLRVGDGQGGLACCSAWGCKELGTTEHAHTLNTDPKSLCFGI